MEPNGLTIESKEIGQTYLEGQGERNYGPAGIYGSLNIGTFTYNKYMHDDLLEGTFVCTYCGSSDRNFGNDMANIPTAVVKLYRRLCRNLVEPNRTR